MALVAAILVAPGAEAATHPADFEEQTIVSGLSRPTMVAWAPDGRMFVAEKNGALKVVPAGSSSARLVKDYSDRVNHYSDRGLLGLAVDSQFAQNGYLYLLYTYDVTPLTADSSSETVSQLLRVRVNGSNQVTEEQVILGTYTSGRCPTASNDVDCIPSNGTSHSIGTVRSAPDGTLWVGNGDAADYGGVDLLALRALDEQSMAGKLLHVDRDGNGLPGHPFCPDNADLTDVCTKIHAKGFRNPFRFSLRPGAGIALGDVGWNNWEEINLVDAGGRSYGWPCYEGADRTPGYRELAACQAEYANPHTGPVHQYPHDGSRAVVGGPTYTGAGYPTTYRNSIFFGDYAGGFVRRLVPGPNGTWTAQGFADGWTGTAIEADPDGNLVYVTVGDFGNGAGSVQRVVYTPGNRSPVARLDANPTSGIAPLTVSFNAGRSSDPDGDSLSFNWDFGDGTGSTAVAPSHTYSAAGTYTVQLTVSDGRGRNSSATQDISAGNTAPQISVSGDTRWRGGQVFRLSASATDAQDGTLPATAFDWNVRLIHAAHTHVGGAGTYSDTRQIAVEANTDHDADSYYLVDVTATDSGGLSSQRTLRVDPETVVVRLRSWPSGVRVSYGGRELTTPQDLTSAVGFSTSVSAPSVFAQGGRIFSFLSWSDGGPRLHGYTVPPGGGTLTATFSGPPQATPGGGVAGTSVDRAGPILRVTKARPAAGRWRGTALDGSGVRRVAVALRGRRAKGGCRWWVPRLGRMSVGRRDCKRPRWLAAELKPVAGGARWLADLGARPAPGRYRLLVKARDKLGNASQLRFGRRTVVRPKR